MAYQPGDHVSIFPKNDANLVEALLGQLDNAPHVDKPIEMQTCTIDSGNTQVGIRGHFILSFLTTKYQYQE